MPKGSPSNTGSYRGGYASIYFKLATAESNTLSLLSRHTQGTSAAAVSFYMPPSGCLLPVASALGLVGISHAGGRYDRFSNDRMAQSIQTLRLFRMAADHFGDHPMFHGIGYQKNFLAVR